ncbi:MAG TPA: bis(5'-nucleosyl)-tetraphosphatase (symmetrical) YqeK [Drouetiella sp.]
MLQQVYEGIPADLTLEKAEEWVRPRTSEKRFHHVRGVAEVARELAEESGCDVFLAELAGWLHDACKEHKDKELVREAEEFGLELTSVDRMNGHLLHGPVAAETIKRDLGVTNKLVLDAIREHTLGAVNMTDLSKVVFLADCLEASRPTDYTDPIWDALHQGRTKKKAKKDHEPPDLDKAILVASDSGLMQLLESGRVIHPKTVDVRNFYLQVIRERDKNS